MGKNRTSSGKPRSLKKMIEAMETDIEDLAIQLADNPCPSPIDSDRLAYNRYRSIKRRYDRRQSRSGYPIKKMLTHKQAKEYINPKGLVTCLLCGFKGENISGHVKYVHKVTGEEYRLAYGIPLYFSLMSCRLEAVSRKNAIFNENLRASSCLFSDKKHHQKALSIKRSKEKERKGKVTFQGREVISNIDKAIKANRDRDYDPIYSQKDFITVLELMIRKDSFPYTFIDEDEDLMSSSAFSNFLNNPSNKKLYKSAISRLTFSARVKARYFIKKDAKRICNLYRTHGSYAAVAKILNINASTVSRYVLGITKPQH